MNEQRRNRLRQVIHPLTSINNFTVQEAKQCCCEASPAYVTVNLKRLVNDGLLKTTAVDDTVRYRWTAPPNEIDPETWIDRQIHGTQVKETPEGERPRERLLRDGA